MIKPKILQLTQDQIKNIYPNKTIYAELTEPGGMGNTGGIILYMLNHQSLICYEQSIFNDEIIFDQIGTMLNDGLQQNETKANQSHQQTFNYYYGGMGNHVFINVNANLTIHENYFIYKKAHVEYQILPSVQGVFNAVTSQLKSNK